MSNVVVKYIEIALAVLALVALAAGDIFDIEWSTFVASTFGGLIGLAFPRVSDRVAVKAVTDGAVSE